MDLHAPVSPEKRNIDTAFKQKHDLRAVPTQPNTEGKRTDEVLHHYSDEASPHTIDELLTPTLIQEATESDSPGRRLRNILQKSSLQSLEENKENEKNQVTFKMPNTDGRKATDKDYIRKLKILTRPLTPKKVLYTKAPLVNFDVLEKKIDEQIEEEKKKLEEYQSRRNIVLRPETMLEDMREEEEEGVITKVINAIRRWWSESVCGLPYPYHDEEEQAAHQVDTHRKRPITNILTSNIEKSALPQSETASDIRNYVKLAYEKKYDIKDAYLIDKVYDAVNQSQMELLKNIETTATAQHVDRPLKSNSQRKLKESSSNPKSSDGINELGKPVIHVTNPTSQEQREAIEKEGKKLKDPLKEKAPDRIPHQVGHNRPDKSADNMKVPKQAPSISKDPKKVDKLNQDGRVPIDREKENTNELSRNIAAHKDEPIAIGGKKQKHVPSDIGHDKQKESSQLNSEETNKSQNNEIEKNKKTQKDDIDTIAKNMDNQKPADPAQDISANKYKATDIGKAKFTDVHTETDKSSQDGENTTSQEQREAIEKEGKKLKDPLKEKAPDRIPHQVGHTRPDKSADNMKVPKQAPSISKDPKKVDELNRDGRVPIDREKENTNELSRNIAAHKDEPTAIGGKKQKHVPSDIGHDKQKESTNLKSSNATERQSKKKDKDKKIQKDATDSITKQMDKQTPADLAKDISAKKDKAADIGKDKQKDKAADIGKDKQKDEAADIGKDKQKAGEMDKQTSADLAKDISAKKDKAADIGKDKQDKSADIGKAKFTDVHIETAESFKDVENTPSQEQREAIEKEGKKLKDPLKEKAPDRIPHQVGHNRPDASADIMKMPKEAPSISKDPKKVDEINQDGRVPIDREKENTSLLSRNIAAYKDEPIPIGGKKHKKVPAEIGHDKLKKHDKTSKSGKTNDQSKTNALSMEKEVGDKNKITDRDTQKPSDAVKNIIANKNKAPEVGKDKQRDESAAPAKDAMPGICPGETVANMTSYLLDLEWPLPSASKSIPKRETNIVTNAVLLPSAWCLAPEKRSTHLDSSVVSLLEGTTGKLNSMEENIDDAARRKTAVNSVKSSDASSSGAEYLSNPAVNISALPPLDEYSPISYCSPSYPIDVRVTDADSCVSPPHSENYSRLHHKSLSGLTDLAPSSAGEAQPSNVSVCGSNRTIAPSSANTSSCHMPLRDDADDNPFGSFNRVQSSSPSRPGDSVLVNVSSRYSLEYPFSESNDERGYSDYRDNSSSFPQRAADSFISSPQLDNNFPSQTASFTPDEQTKEGTVLSLNKISDAQFLDQEEEIQWEVKNEGSPSILRILSELTSLAGNQSDVYSDVEESSRDILKRNDKNCLKYSHIVIRSMVPTEEVMSEYFSCHSPDYGVLSLKSDPINGSDVERNKSIAEQSDIEEAEVKVSRSLSGNKVVMDIASSITEFTDFINHM